MKLLKWLFGKGEETEDSSNLLIDEKNSYAEEKKNKLTTDHYIEEQFYVHEKPDPPARNENMSDTIKTDMNNAAYIEDGQGNFVQVNPNSLGQTPAGVNIPGIGHVGGNQPQRRPQPRPQQRPQQNMQQPTQQRPMQQPAPQHPVQQQQPVHQVPVQQVPVQQAVQQFPYVQMATVADAYHLFMDLPGVKKSSLSIQFHDGSIVVSGKRECNIDALKKDLKGPKRTRKTPILKKVETVPKFLMNTFSFAYPFEKMIDESAITATLEDGILHVTLPHRAKGEAVSVSLG